MQYQVPQFIETEDKIIGGVLTLKQFLIIAAATGFSFIFYFIFTSLAWLIMTSLVGVIAVGVAFVKIQGRSMPTLMAAAFHYYWQPRFYLWRAEKPESEPAFLEAKTMSTKQTELNEFVFHKKTKEDALSPVPPSWHERELVSSPKSFLLQSLKGTFKGVGDVVTDELKSVSRGETKPAEVTRELSRAIKEKEKVQKEALAVLEEKLLKKEELLEHEVEELKNSKARLEAEIKKILEDKSVTKKETARPVPVRRIMISSNQNRASLTEERDEMPENAKKTPSEIREKLAIAGKVQDLFQKIMTSKTSIPKREKQLFNCGKHSKEQYELLRRATGEIEPARRVDYGDSRR